MIKPVIKVLAKEYIKGRNYYTILYYGIVVDIVFLEPIQNYYISVDENETKYPRLLMESAINIFEATNAYFLPR